MQVYFLVKQVRKVGTILLKFVADILRNGLSKNSINHPYVLVFEVASQVDQHKFLAVACVPQF